MCQRQGCPEDAQGHKAHRGGIFILQSPSLSLQYSILFHYEENNSFPNEILTFASPYLKGRSELPRPLTNGERRFCQIFMLQTGSLRGE